MQHFNHETYSEETPRDVCECMNAFRYKLHHGAESFLRSWPVLS